MVNQFLVADILLAGEIEGNNITKDHRSRHEQSVLRNQ
jgi:hypothetical protein